MEYLNFLDLGVPICSWVSASQRSHFNEWARSAYLRYYFLLAIVSFTAGVGNLFTITGRINSG